MAVLPPDESGPEEQRPETENFGWFILCNERVVVAGDKSAQTGWGTHGVNSWHPQYNGFLGLVEFSSDDPRKLPWRTTKRDVDDTNPLYQRALVHMRSAASAWTKYTNDRKADLAGAKAEEAATQAIPAKAAKPSTKLVMPARSAVKSTYSSIQYSRPQAEIAKAKKLAGNERMSNVQLGEHTFKYFIASEEE